MTTIPDFVPMLRRGKGRNPQEGGCLVQVAGWLSDGHSWSDRAPSVHPLLRAIGIWLNDSVTDADRHRLAPSAARLSDSAGAVDDTQQDRLIAGMAAWAVRSVRDLAPGPAVHECVNYELRHGPIARSRFSYDAVTRHVADAVRLSYDRSTSPDAVLAAAFAIKYSRGDLVAWFEALLDEFDRLAGRTSQPMTEDQGKAVCAVMSGAAA